MNKGCILLRLFAQMMLNMGDRQIDLPFLFRRKCGQRPQQRHGIRTTAHRHEQARSRPDPAAAAQRCSHRFHQRIMGLDLDGAIHAVIIAMDWQRLITDDASGAA